MGGGYRRGWRPEPAPVQPAVVMERGDLFVYVLCVRASSGRERERESVAEEPPEQWWERTEGDEGGECKYLIINKSVPN